MKCARGPRSSGGGCGGRGPTGAEPTSGGFLGFSARPSSHLPGDPCPQGGIRSAPTHGSAPPADGAPGGAGRHTTVYPRLRGADLTEEQKKSLVSGQSRPRKTTDCPSGASLLMQLLWERLQGRQRPGVLLRMGRRVFRPGGSRSLSATRHTEQPRASLSGRGPKERAPRAGASGPPSDCPLRLM